MKENKEFTKLNLEELKKKEKALNTAFQVIIGMVIVMVIVGIYITIKQGPGVFLFLPLAFTPIITTNYMNLKKIRLMIKEKEQSL